MTVTMLNTGEELMASFSQSSSDAEFDDDEYRFYKEIAAIEQITKQPILLPATALSDNDHHNLFTMRALLRSPVMYETWTDANLVYLHDGMGESELADLVSGKETTIRYQGEMTAQFNGNQYLLGRFQRDIKSARLDNLEEVQRALEEFSGQDKLELQLRLVPGLSNEMRTVFLDWIEAPAAALFREHANWQLDLDDEGWVRDGGGS
jgi:hypothetical protein